MLQYNPTVTGSLQVSGDITGTVNGINITGLSQSVSTQLINVQVSTGSSDAKFETLSGVTSSALTRLTNIESKSASVDISISNINSITSSFSPRVSNLESKSSSVDISISNINSITASNIARLSNLETKSSSVDISISSINTFTSSNDTKFTTLGTYTGSLDTKNTTLAAVTSSLISKTGSYATTGSNSFYGTQVFSGSVYIANDLIVQGSSSIQYISASSVSIGTNIVQLNTANPSVRFAGLTIIDSGSIGGSGSFLYDSVHDEFVFVHRGNGTNVTSSHFVLGPETFDNLGNETYLTCNRLPKGTGKEHLVDSCIYHDSNTTCIYNGALVINSSCQFMFGIAPADFAFNVGTTCVGTNASIAQFFNNDYTSTTRGFIRVRNSATISSTTSAYFGQGQDQKTYFYNNDTSRLGDIVITNTGKVGIGTASPIAQLHVKTDVASESRPTTLATSATNSAAYITTICGSNAGIAFGQLGANSNYIQSTYQDGSACTPLILNPYSGNVGIGTGNTAPGGALDVVTCSNTTQNFYLRNTNNLDASSRAYFNVVAGNTSLSLLALAGGGSCGGTYIAGTCGADMYFQQQPGGAVNMFISCTGNVGIGTTTPATKLEVKGANTYNKLAACFFGTYNAGFAFSDYLAGLTYDAGGNTFCIYSNYANYGGIILSTATNPRLVISSCGCVGINNTVPRAALEVGQSCSDQNNGGFMFRTLDLPDNTWTTFYTPPANWAGLTFFNWVGTNDFNRSGAAQIRWSYQPCAAQLGPTTTIFNDNQNAPGYFRNSGGNMQICVDGAGAGKRLQVMIMGSRGA